MEGTAHAAGACRERDGWRGGKQRDAIVVEYLGSVYKLLQNCFINGVEAIQFFE